MSWSNVTRQDRWSFVGEMSFNVIVIVMRGVLF